MVIRDAVPYTFLSFYSESIVFVLKLTLLSKMGAGITPTSGRKGNRGGFVLV